MQVEVDKITTVLSQPLQLGHERDDFGCGAFRRKRYRCATSVEVHLLRLLRRRQRRGVEGTATRRTQVLNRAFVGELRMFFNCLNMKSRRNCAKESS